MTREIPQERKLFSEILDAFMRNPEMVDNLEGIARWRIMNARIQSDVEETKEVLDALVSEGYLLAIETADGPLFQANREKLAAAKRLMQDLSGSRRDKSLSGSGRNISAVRGFCDPPQQQDRKAREIRTHQNKSRIEQDRRKACQVGLQGETRWNDCIRVYISKKSRVESGP
jgi:Icc-related predicted phosphoesterase